MNIFNRIFTTVSILVLTVLIVAALVIPDVLLSITSGVLNTALATPLVIRILLALVVIAVIALLLWLELRRSGSNTVEVARSSGGSIRITTSDIADRIQQQVDGLSGVIAAKARVSARDNAVIARVDVQTAPGADLLAKGEEVAAVTRSVVQDELGLKVYGKPQITLKAAGVKQLSAKKITPSAPVTTPPDTTSYTGANTGTSTNTDTDATKV